MNYYRIDPCLFGEYWAWGESITENPVFSEETAARCPLCGRMVQGRNWMGPYDIRLNKKSKIGDFIYGTPFNVLASQRFVDLFTMAGLKGIRVEQKVNLYYRKNLVTESYFLLEFEYSTKKVELARELNEERTRDKTLPKCSLCKKMMINTSVIIKRYILQRRENLTFLEYMNNPGDCIVISILSISVNKTI